MHTEVRVYKNNFKLWYGAHAKKIEQGKDKKGRKLGKPIRSSKARASIGGGCCTCQVSSF